MRARSALASGSAETLLESIWSYGNGIVAEAMTRPAADRRHAQAQIETLLAVLDRELHSNTQLTRRANEVRARLAQGLAQLARP
jgi:hypothetical protein